MTRCRRCSTFSRIAWSTFFPQPGQKRCRFPKRSPQLGHFNFSRSFRCTMVKVPLLKSISVTFNWMASEIRMPVFPRVEAKALSLGVIAVAISFSSSLPPGLVFNSREVVSLIISLLSRLIKCSFVAWHVMPTSAYVRLPVSTLRLNSNKGALCSRNQECLALPPGRG